MDVMIHLKDDYHLIKIIINEDDGSRSEKEITRQTFSEIFKQESKNEYFCKNEIFRTFPEVENIEGLLYGSKHQKDMKGIYFVPAAKMYMNIVGEKSMIPYPSMIFCFSAKAGILLTSYCYAVKEKKLSELKASTKLYNFPFGNVEPYDHHICWGTNKMTNLYDYEDLREAIGTFFYSESNKDYVSSGKSFNKKYGTYEEFLKILKEKERFPGNALVPCDNNLTLETIFNSICTKKEEE